MRKIIITGARGVIGRVLTKSLTEYQITPLDLPEKDITNYRRLLKIFPGHEAVIHLAWDTKTENWKSGKINPENILMAYNVYKATLRCKVPRVIMASSVHADGFVGWNKPELLTPDRTPFPTSPYGASKVFVEALGRYFAKKYKLEVICVRFGGVNTKDVVISAPEEKDYNKVWLSHRDCTALIKSCLEAETIPDNFVILYGVSNNKTRVHNTSNPLGWAPSDGAE